MNSISSLLAYIDPGSGSAIISAIIGFFVASGLVIKTYWYKIKRFFTGSQNPKEENSSPLKSEE
jgi:hypothetical protein